MPISRLAQKFARRRLSSAERVSRLQSTVDVAQEEVLRNLTMRQRATGVGEKLPAPKAVATLGSGTSAEGRTGRLLGISTRPQAPKGKIAAFQGLFAGLKAVGALPGLTTSVSLLAERPKFLKSGARGVVRHEAAHHVLTFRGQFKEQHARISEAAVVPSRGVDFRLLETASLSASTGTQEQRGRLRRQQTKVRRQDTRQRSRERTGLTSRPRVVPDIRSLF